MIKIEYPKHWGKEPEVQTRDITELPNSMGQGSSTTKAWILYNLERDKFITACRLLIKESCKTSSNSGFEKGNDGEALALVHSEISEALEAIRHGNPPDDKIPDFSNLEAELADAVIRIFNFSGQRNLRLAEAILAKMSFNKTRPHKHGGKLF